MTIFSKVVHIIKLEDSNMMQNKDLVPIPVKRRKWGFPAYVWYWGMNSLCVVTWSAGSSLLALGVNGSHAMGIIVIANLLISLAAAGNGYYAGKYHIGFSVFQKVIFGTKGYVIGVLLRAILSVVWFADEAWLGGLCINVIIASWSKRYLNWKNTFPDSVPMTSQELCGFVIYLILTLPLLCIRPEYLDSLLAIGTFAIFFMGIGITVWAVHANAGSYGSLMSENVELSSSKLGWAWVYGISTWYSSLTSGIANQGDFSRYNKSPKGSTWGIILGTNITGFLVPLFGILSASSLYEKYGTYYWMPNDICMRWLQDNYNAKSRAAAFFSGLALVASQMGVNTVGNCISGSMDLASLAPQFINIRRGSFVVLLLAWVCQPWTYFDSDSIFIVVMSSFSVFLTPLIAVYICDFYVVRKCQLKISDCYVSTSKSSYWYNWGFNFRSIISFLIGVAPGLPGLINAANSNLTITEGAMHFYQGSCIFQFAISFACHYFINRVWKVDIEEQDDTDFFDTFTAEECSKLNMIPYTEDGKHTHIIEKMHQEGEIPVQKEAESPGVKSMEDISSGTGESN